jgi:hypothetical protein
MVTFQTACSRYIHEQKGAGSCYDHYIRQSTFLRRSSRDPVLTLDIDLYDLYDPLTTHHLSPYVSTLPLGTITKDLHP